MDVRASDTSNLAAQRIELERGSQSESVRIAKLVTNLHHMRQFELTGMYHAQNHLRIQEKIGKGKYM